MGGWMWRVKGFEGWAALLTALAAGSANVTPQKWQDWFTRARLSSTLSLSHLLNKSTVFLILDGQRKRNATITEIYKYASRCIFGV